MPSTGCESVEPVVAGCEPVEPVVAGCEPVESVVAGCEPVESVVDGCDDAVTSSGLSPTLLALLTLLAVVVASLVSAFGSVATVSLGVV